MTDARLCALLAAVGAAAIFCALLLGATPISPATALSGLFGGADAATRTVLHEIRLPRALAAYLVGAALGAAGAAQQGLFRNPLADPGLLGVTAFASLAATVTIFFGLAATFVWATPIAAVAGALAATALLGFAAVRTASVITLILIGVGLSSFTVALMTLLLNLAPNPFTLSDMVNWTLGTVANRSLADIALAAPVLAAGAALLAFAARGLDALSLGEETAAGLGVDLARTRLLVVAGTGLICGGAVSLAGAVGFVGLVAPHLVRPLVAHAPSRTLAPAALLGGAILVLADIGVRLLPTESELSLGVVAALFGAPVFVWIAAARRGAAHG